MWERDRAPDEDHSAGQQQGRHGQKRPVRRAEIAAEETGERVFMVHLDPQGSLSAWASGARPRRRREAPQASP
jgi:hypothetical protein